MQDSSLRSNGAFLINNSTLQHWTSDVLSTSDEDKSPRGIDLLPSVSGTERALHTAAAVPMTNLPLVSGAERALHTVAAVPMTNLPLVSGAERALHTAAAVPMTNLPPVSGAERAPPLWLLYLWWTNLCPLTLSTPILHNAWGQGWHFYTSDKNLPNLTQHLRPSVPPMGTIESILNDEKKGEEPLKLRLRGETPPLPPCPSSASSNSRPSQDRRAPERYTDPENWGPSAKEKKRERWSEAAWQNLLIQSIGLIYYNIEI